MCRKALLLVLVMGLSISSQAATETIYYDNFDGGAVDLNNTTPDVSLTGAQWLAGPDFDADGTVIYILGDLGASAYLPFVPKDGYIYTLSATLDVRATSLTPTGQTDAEKLNNWIAFGFAQSAFDPNKRFYADPGPGSASAVYWAMSRTNQAAAGQYDQDFNGVNTAGGLSSSGQSQDNLKIVLNTTSSNWTASWYFNNTLHRTVTVTNSLKPNFQYIMISENRCDGYIDDLLLTRDLGPKAADPSPASGATGVSRSAVLGWTSGKYAVKHDVYLGTSFTDVNNATRGTPLGVLVSQNQTANTYDPPGLLDSGKTYYWRIDEVNGAPGYEIYKGTVWDFTTVTTAGTLYYDNFDGPNDVDLNGRTPDITIGTNVWAAGAVVDADGYYDDPSTGNSGFTAALPFTRKIGAVYELSAKVNNFGVDWFGVAFLNTAPNVNARPSDNTPYLWSLVRGKSQPSPPQKDQSFTGAGTGGGSAASTISASDIKVRVEMINATNWVVKWFFNGSKDRETTVNPSTLGITNSTIYAAFGGNSTFNPCSGNITSFRLEEIPQALKPYPANGSMIYSTNIILQWQPGIYATQHDVYIGTSFADVNNANTSTSGIYKGRQDPNNYPLTGLTQGATYYWRIDEVNLPSVWKGDVWSFTVQPMTAYNPSPPNGAKYMDIDVNLAWSKGAKAVKHDVYLGTSYNNVNTATRANPLGVLVSQNQDPNTYNPPANLTLGSIYYWRIDEVNSNAWAPPGSPWKGDVWSFQTIPSIPITDATLLGWWKLDEDWGVRAIDWSGHGYHGTLINGPRWAGGRINGALQFDGLNDQVSLPIGPVINSLTNSTFAIWVNWARIGAPTQRIFDFGTGTTDYMYLTPGNGGGGGTITFTITTPGGSVSLAAPTSLAAGWHHLAVVIDNTTLQMQLYVDALPVASTITTVFPSNLGNTTSNWLGRSQAGDYTWFIGFLDDFRIYNRVLTQGEIGSLMIPLEAWGPNPADGTTDTETTLTLNWFPGVKAAKHDVYFSDNWDDVNEAKSSDPNGPAYVYKGRQDANSYAITTPLEFDTTYYWRIDEVNEPNKWRGSIWSFTTGNYVVKDNFESYNNTTNKIQNTWIKGGGGTVGYSDPTYAELTVVHAGRQSMPFDYNNTKSPYYSEATRTFATAQDWTANGVKSLTLWLRGYPAPVGGFTRSASSPYSYTMTASGTDINTPDLRHLPKVRDEFHYAYVQVNYECDIIAKVDSLSNTNSLAKAGLMMRDSLADDSAYVMMCITPSSGIWYQYRPTAGQLQDSGRVTRSGLTAPHWLWLRREFNGSDYEWSGYYSAKSEPNQYDWTPLVSDGNIPVTAHSSVDTVYIGLVVTASNAAATCTGLFSNVSVTDGGLGTMYNNWPARANPVALPWPWPNTDIGIKSNNAAPLYVTLQDSTNAKKVTHPDPNIVLSTSWQAWNIALSDFAGVNLAAIKKITIGVDSMSTPAGTLYFDDIRLYIPRCLPGTIPDPTSSNCLIEYYNLGILTNNWLISNYQVTPAAPSATNLVAYYNFNGNFNDSAGGHNGEPNGALIINDAVRGQVANFDGINDYVSLPIGPDINSMSSATFATWVNFSNGGGAWQRIFDFGSSTTVYMFLTPRTGTTGPIRFAIITTGTTTESGINAPSTLARGWHHVAVVINGANMTMQLYLDGMVVASGTTAVLPTDLGNTTNNWLGRSQWTADAYLNGYLDDFRIYNRALSPGEIASLAGKTALFTQPLYLLLTPQNQGINLYNDGRIDLKDYAVLADLWLEELLWP